MNTQIEEEFEKTLSLERQAFEEKLRLAEEEKERIRLELERLENERLKEREEVETEIQALIEAERMQNMLREGLEEASKQEKLELEKQAEEGELKARREREEKERIAREREELQRMVDLQKIELENANERARQQKEEYDKMLEKQKADQALSLAEKEAAALKILAELTRAEKETLANTEKIPVTNRNSLMNQPTGGTWDGSVYVCSSNPQGSYSATKTGPGTQTDTISAGFAGLMSKTKDFGSRIGKEMKHSLIEGRVENDHETINRFTKSFKFEKEEPFYLEFSCKFTANGGTMMIGFGYITKNFLCMSGGNARDLISIIIPLVDIKTISMATTAMFSSYSAVPKITAVTNAAKANAILVFDIYDHVHNIFSVNNPVQVQQILNLRTDECKKNSIVGNFVAGEDVLNQVATSTWAQQRVVATNTTHTPGQTVTTEIESPLSPRKTPSRPPAVLPTQATNPSWTVTGEIPLPEEKTVPIGNVTIGNAPIGVIPVGFRSSVDQQRSSTDDQQRSSVDQPQPRGNFPLPTQSPAPVQNVEEKRDSAVEKRDSAVEKRDSAVDKRDSDVPSKFSERNPFAKRVVSQGNPGQG